jgi:hypothetical protein
LIKLYGDLQQKDTLVITASDHAGLFRDRHKEGLIDEVRRTFSRNVVLFIGYNLADPDFRTLLDSATEDRRNMRSIFAVWPDLSERVVQMWEGRGVIMLPQNPLPSLLDQAESPNEPKLPPPSSD